MFEVLIPILTPLLEEHRSYEVYTVDVSPDGKRLATGGLDGKIRIWYIDSILQYAKKTKNQWNLQFNRPIASMSRHTGSVTTVKFSPDGKYLVSGSDDRILLVWEREDGSTKPSFGSDCDLEHWNVRKRLVAHDNDIQDICWAPDSSILVTVGLDRSIIVWNGSTFEKIKRFDVHQSHVKGIVFDPANKYFATASDDRTVKIFRYHKIPNLSFTIEHIITEPFQSSPLTTYFRRLSWSPDGQHIAVPNATNGPVSTVSIINRGTWETPISLVGHDQPTEVACFNPRLFEYEESKKSNSKDSENIDSKVKKQGNRVESVIATAGQDKTLVVWSTQRARPIFVAFDIANKSITDMVWMPQGDALFLTSLDSYIIVVAFENNELGKPIPLEQNIEQLHRYGIDRNSLVFPESVKQLILEEIIPCTRNIISEKSSFLEDRLNSIQNSNILTTSNMYSNSTEILNPLTINHVPLEKKSHKLNKIVLKDGKKRIMPTLISTNYSPTKLIIPNNEITSHIQAFTLKKNNLYEFNRVMKTKLSQPSFPVPRLGLHTLIMGIKEKNFDKFYKDIEDQQNDTSWENKSNDQSNEYIITLNSKTTLEKIWKDEPNTRYLDYPSVVPDADTVMCECGDIDNIYVLEIKNGSERALQFDTDALFDNPSRILGYYNAERQIEAFIPEVILTCVGSIECQCWALATAMGSIYLIGFHGQMKYPRLSIGHKVIKLVCCNKYLIAFTESCLFYAWDLKNMKSVYKELSALPILGLEPLQSNRVRINSRITDFYLDSMTCDLVVEMANNIFYRWIGSLGCWAYNE